MQVTIKRSIMLLGLQAVGHATVPPGAAETQVVSTFEGNRGPAWEADADVTGMVGPGHIVGKEGTAL